VSLRLTAHLGGKAASVSLSDHLGGGHKLGEFLNDFPTVTGDQTVEPLLS
jgi:hypothetical protein